MTKPLNRFDSHVKARLAFLGAEAAAEYAAQERAANRPFFFDLKPSDSYATIYESSHDAARPIGTITRPRLLGEARFKLWTVAYKSGAVVYSSRLRPSAMQATRALIRAAAQEAAAAADKSSKEGL